MYKCPVPAGLSRSRRSVVFIIVTSAGLPEEPVPRWRSVLLDFTSLLDLRVRHYLQATSRRPRRRTSTTTRLLCACCFLPFWRIGLEFPRTTAGNARRVSFFNCRRSAFSWVRVWPENSNEPALGLI